MDEKEQTNEVISEENTSEVTEVKEETTQVAEEVATVEETAEVKEEATTQEEGKRGSRGRRDRNNKRRKVENAEPAPVSEWKETVVQISRVTKVVKGGKKLSFRAIVVVGNQKGQVGVGCAKAAEVIIAIQKAVADGRKNLVTVPIFKTTIPHPITGRSGAGSVMLRPAAQGTGVIAGGAVRAVLELAGIENILSKSLGSKSPLNAAGATIDALKSLKTFKEVAKKRGMALTQMLN